MRLSPSEIDAALSFIQEAQRDDGGFWSLSTTDPQDFSQATRYRSTFPTSLILNALCDLETERAKAIKGNASFFLRNQFGARGTLNYWERETAEAATMPYPDDLDDTACAAAALSRMRPSAIDGSQLARIVMALTSLESREGGPYRTWLVPEGAPSKWTDVDVAVNANVAFFLSAQEVSLPSLTSFLDAAIERGAVSSPYYPSSLPVCYFLARGYAGTDRARLTEHARSSIPTNPSVLDLALAVSTLARLGDLQAAEELATRLSEKKEGWRRAYPFCLDPAAEGMRRYAGSEPLTVAFCLEAFEALAQAERGTSGAEKTGESPQPFAGVYTEVQSIFDDLEGDLAREARRRLDAVQKRDKDGQIAGLSKGFASCLKKSAPSESLLLTLAVCNILGWLAYTVYDDFLDQEGEKEGLSVANVCLRGLVSRFEEVGRMLPGFLSTYRAVMDGIDAANAWEIARCRPRREEGILSWTDLPDFGEEEKLAERSLGHALGPVAILHAVERADGVPSLLNFFRHFLIARQLNDDAHDWEEDLKAGRLTPANVDILRRIGNSGKLDMDAMEAKREEFWRDDLPGLAERIFLHLENAKAAAKELEEIVEATFFDRLLMPLESKTKKALEERERTLSFLSAYR